MRHAVFRLGFAGWLLVGAVPAALAGAADIDFSRDIQPIISSRCFQCHGPDEASRKAKLRLDIRDEAVRPRKDGLLPIKPGDADSSEVMRRLLATDPDDVMPPPKEGHPLAPEEIDRIRRWIAAGAPYAGHWAFRKPVRPGLPRVKDRAWPRNGLDYFILARLEASGLRPSPPADPAAWIRRVSLDLTGLPPTPQEVEAFLRDRSPVAEERVVDRLLGSPHFGERWARIWLDLARYADSAGYGSDPLRLNIWPYRDWVIRAFNRNLPYDRFTLEQLAGDLLEGAGEEELVATAFHRNTMTNTEGGTDDEEWRVAAVKDRIGVTAQAWMGLTLNCAQCHTHKFDPISHKEYYQFYALFNQTADVDNPDERPIYPLFSPDQKRQLQVLSNELTSIERLLGEDTPQLVAELESWEKAWKTGEVWHVLEPLGVKSSQGTGLEVLPDRSVKASGGKEPKETYLVEAVSAVRGATGFRIEALADDSLPGNGPGLSENGNFVLNHVEIDFTPREPRPAKTRFVRVSLGGKDRFLSLAEVQVFSGGTNVALGGRAVQSSTDYGGDAARAIDGNTDGRYDAARSTTHTRQESDPWWEVDLGREWPVDRVEVWNRTDADVSGRLNGFKLEALAADRAVSYSTAVGEPGKPNTVLALDGSRRISLANASADYSQAAFGAEKAIDAASERRSGWAVGDGTGRSHALYLEATVPVEPGRLTFRLVHDYGERTLLGRFRLSVTGSPRPVRHVPEAVAAVLQVEPDRRSAAEIRAVRDWFRLHANATASINARIRAVRARQEAVKPVRLPVMREVPSDERRVTRVLNKGNFLDPGDEVRPGFPSAFGEAPKDLPMNRAGVVRWLFSPENPLTARVAANRFWGALFGTGIVETEEDFGTQGQLPSHPELLDWLAVTFASQADPLKSPGTETAAPALEWDMKAFLKLLVTSATYRQSSRITPEGLAADPRNRLLSRFPRQRLDAEMVRDQALALSGLLSRKIGGPSVYPPQPDGMWKAAFNGERTYTTSTGGDRYRRGLYTIWRRTVPYPSMATFDAPSRETCTVRRLPTNTPLQAFVTLNDPVYVESAQALGRRLALQGSAGTADRIRFGLRLVLARMPDEAQVRPLLELFQSELRHYREHPEEALALATQPAGPLPAGLRPAEAAAWTVVANVLLNLDGVLTKG